MDTKFTTCSKDISSDGHTERETLSNVQKFCISCISNKAPSILAKLTKLTPLNRQNDCGSLNVLHAQHDCDLLALGDDNFAVLHSSVQLF